MLKTWVWPLTHEDCHSALYPVSYHGPVDGKDSRHWIWNTVSGEAYTNLYTLIQQLYFDTTDVPHSQIMISD